MKIRTKFSLWISFASFITAILFSLFILHELKEEFIEMLDHELSDIAAAIFSELESTKGSGFLLSSLPHNYPLSRYWLQVSDETGKILFSSNLAEHVSLPKKPKPETSFFPDLSFLSNKVTDWFDDSDEELKGFSVEQRVATEYLWVPADEREEVKEFGDKKIQFWVSFFERDVHGRKMYLHIAKPLLIAQIEYQEIVFGLFWGIVITLIFVLVMSLAISHRMLKPLAIINTRIRQIREKSLDKRIIQGKSKDELYELTSSLNSMFDRIEHSFKQQKEFVSDAAHELKSPLTVLILGHEEMLASEPDNTIKQELEKQLTIMLRMNKLVRDLLSLSRLEQTDTLNREKINPQLLINEIIEQYEDMIVAKGVEITVDVASAFIFADGDKLQRLVINLVDNAIKYNLEKDGWIAISGTCKNDSFLLEISNSGTLIPEEDIPCIFDQFYRVEKSRSHSHGGSGLGLTIVKRITDIHGGTITVSSTAEKTSFKVSIKSISPVADLNLHIPSA